MALATVTDFLEQVITDPALQAELSKALEADNDREAATAIARSKGYDFTSDELWAEVQKRQAEFEQNQGSTELSDEELEAVAGGISPTIIVATIVLGASAAVAGTAPQIKW